MKIWYKKQLKKNNKKKQTAGLAFDRPLTVNQMNKAGKGPRD